MALFKIFKGNANKLGAAPGVDEQDTRVAHEGFAYFTPDDGKFYIDIADADTAVVGTNRIPLSADKADFLKGNKNENSNLAIIGAPSEGLLQYYYRVQNNVTGMFTSGNNANAIIQLNKYSTNYTSQLGFNDAGKIFYRNFNGVAANATLPWKEVAFTDSSITGNASTATAAHLTTTVNSVAYFSDTSGTFASKASANGALYATVTDGTLQWGTLPVAQGGTGNTSFGANRLAWASSTTLLEASSHYVNDTKIAINSLLEPSYNLYVNGTLGVYGATTFLTTPTAPTAAATTNDTTLATTEFVYNAFTTNDAMVFKGIVDATHDLPVNHKQGWTYKVAAAGTYAGQVCEVGDTIYCIEDSSDGASAQINSDWVVVQNNIDILPVAKGGTGNSSMTGNRMVWSSSATQLTADNHYVAADKIAINSTDAPASNLFVNGTTVISGDTAIGNTASSSEKMFSILTDGGRLILRNDSTTSNSGAQKKGLYIKAAGGAEAWGLQFNQSNQISEIADFVTNPRPATNNTQTLGDATHNWSNFYASCVTIGGSLEYGDEYTPVYFTGGVPTEANVVAQVAFTINNEMYGVQLNHSSFRSNSYVLQIVVESGAENLTAPIQWQSSHQAGDPSQGGHTWIKLYCATPTTGIVSGYILVARGTTITQDLTSTQISSANINA